MRIPFSLVFSIVILTLSLQANAHRYHFGLTELSVNERTQTLEISHRFFVADMERALSLSASKELKEAHQQMDNYVNTRFQLSGENGEPLVPQWVGMEADVHDVWIYQEIPLASIQSEKLKVRQSMLMEIEGDQVNTINITGSGETQSYTLKPGASAVMVIL